MTNIIRAEFLKSKRTMSSKLIVVFPIITLVMAFVLTLGMTNAYAESAWNWWYVLLLPGMIAIVSYLSVIRGEYPKVCVNLQTDVRYNYSVWRLFLWQEEKTAHKKQQ